MSDLSPGSAGDPIQQLESFGNGGIAVNPLDPAAVRRLGDQRRRRQHAMYGAIAAAVLTAAVVPAAILATRDSGAPPVAPVPGPTSSATPSPTPTETFPAGGVTVRSEADLAALVGTSDEFKAFIGATLAANRTADCPNAEIGVQKYDDTGFALGTVGGCGGYVALWSVQNGAWKEALGTQDEWLCGDLNRFDVPDGFAGECYGPKELLGPDEDYGIRLGMSADEIGAVGGTAKETGSGSCSYVFPPGAPPTVTANGPVGSIGYLSLDPDRGVVALFAQKDQVTPRGIRQGDTFAQLKKAYPEGRIGDHAAWWVAIDAEHSYRFDIDGDDTVQNISLVLNGPQGCYE